jgi:hypothetical protein
MDLTIALPDDLGETLKAHARAQGVSPATYASRVLERTLIAEHEDAGTGQPFETGRGMLAKYGRAPSAEEIRANRDEMFRGFAREIE